MILRLESTDGWRRVTNVDDRVDRDGWTVIRLRRRLSDYIVGEFIENEINRQLPPVKR